MNLKELTLKYFNTFSNKDVDGLRELFSCDVSLRDWEISASGIEEVINANQKIFDSLDTISVVPIEICQTGNITASEMEIHINNSESIKVVDIIEFNSDCKICAIRAYKG